MPKIPKMLYDSRFLHWFSDTYMNSSDVLLYRHMLGSCVDLFKSGAYVQEITSRGISEVAAHISGRIIVDDFQYSKLRNFC